MTIAYIIIYAYDCQATPNKTLIYTKHIKIHRKVMARIQKEDCEKGRKTQMHETDVRDTLYSHEVIN